MATRILLMCVWEVDDTCMVMNSLDIITINAGL